MNSLSDIVGARKRSISSRIAANSLASMASTSALVATTAATTQGFNYQLSRDLAYLNGFKESYREQVTNMLSSNPDFQGYRSKAVSLAWMYEQKAAEYGGKCSESWITQNKDELLRRGSIAGAEGHHQQSVAYHPEEQANPDNIKFYRNRSEHLEKGHDGNFQNESDAAMIDRTTMVENANRRRVIANEVRGAGLTALIAFVTSASITFIVTMAKNGRNPEMVKKALKASGRNGLEGAGLALACYGVTRLILKPGTKTISGLFEKLGINVSEKAVSTGIIAAVTIVITASYTYIKLRRAGVSARDSIRQVARQSALSITITCCSIMIANSLGNGYALAFTIVISAGMIGYSIYQTSKEKELMERISLLQFDREYSRAIRSIQPASYSIALGI